MRILIASYAFSPKVGGVEMVGALLAAELVRMGHQTIVVTETRPSLEAASESVIRRPSLRHFFRLARSSDVILINNPCIKYLVLALASRRPVCVSIHTWIRRNDQSVALRDRLKLCLVNQCGARVVASEALARSVRSTCVIHPCYDPEIFRRTSSKKEASCHSFAFVGRLVPTKGTSLLMQTFAKFVQTTATAELVIIGDGPERSAMERSAQLLGVSHLTRFEGFRTPAEVAEILGASDVLIVPSEWAEPFGIVVLEGLALGLRVICTEQGGLKEAGLTFVDYFEAGDSLALLSRLQKATALSGSTGKPRPSRDLSQHLLRHSPALMTQAYCRVFEGLLR